jgi:hypothetical protein
MSDYKNEIQSASSLLNDQNLEVYTSLIKQNCNKEIGEIRPNGTKKGKRNFVIISAKLLLN